MKNKTLPFNLQYFAQPTSDGAGAGDDNGSGEGENGVVGESGNDDAGGDGAEPTFDDLLNSGHQAEFDRRVQKAINTALSNQKSKYEALMDDKLSEAEKLAKMTKEEKQDYISKKHEKELTDREVAITKRELMAEAKNTLVEKKLPVSLAEILNYADAESCNRSIEALEKVFQESVSAVVEEKLRGGNPPKRATGNESTQLDDIVKAMSE